MIVTLTLNPSLDRTLLVDELIPGAVLRTSAPTTEAGGKGVNVTRVLSANGYDSVAVLPVGGSEGAELERLLHDANVATRIVPVHGRTRSNISIVQADAVVTKLNEPGFPLVATELDDLLTELRAVVSPGDWIVVSGSLPPEFSADGFRSFLAQLSALEVCLAIDTSGDALVASLAARPRVIKPNRDELSELVGRPIDTVAEAVSAAQQVHQGGVELVLVSLGADGAVLVSGSGVVVGSSETPRPLSTVGAGDSFLAGFLVTFARDEADLEGALREALAWGAAAASLPGSAMPGPSDIDRSLVRLVPAPVPDRPLLAT